MVRVGQEQGLDTVVGVVGAAVCAFGTTHGKRTPEAPPKNGVSWLKRTLTHARHPKTVSSTRVPRATLEPRLRGQEMALRVSDRRILST